MSGERPARHVAYVQHQVRVVRGAVREGERAPAPVPEQDVDVLAGPVPEAFGRRELKPQLHHVVGEPGARRDAGGEGAHPFAGAVRPGRDADVGGGPRLAEEGPAGPHLPFGQAAQPRALRQVDPAGDDPAPAGAAGAVPASVGERHALPERRVEDGFVGPGEKGGALRLQRNVEHREVGGGRRAEGSGGYGAGIWHPYRVGGGVSRLGRRIIAAGSALASCLVRPDLQGTPVSSESSLAAIEHFQCAGLEAWRRGEVLLPKAPSYHHVLDRRDSDRTRRSASAWLRKLPRA